MGLANMLNMNLSFSIPLFNLLVSQVYLFIIELLQVNNAGTSGVIVDEDGLRAMKIDPESWVCYVYRL